MKYIKTVMDSLSAITTSETGQACLRIAKAETAADRRSESLRFAADLSDLDDLLSKADTALHLLNENRTQFDKDHRDQKKQPPHVGKIVRLLDECAAVSDTLRDVFNHTETDAPQSWTGDSHIIRRVAAWSMYGNEFRECKAYLIKTYASPFDRFILVEDKEGVKAKLHQLLDGQKGVRLAVVVVAAQETGLIDGCVGYGELSPEFRIEGTRQAYFIGRQNISEHRMEYEARIEQAKKILTC